jgi:flagellar motor switch protein FliN/FliY
VGGHRVSEEKKLAGETGAVDDGNAHVEQDAARLRPFLDVPVQVSVELARRAIKVREVLALQTDSVLAMDQSAGENVDLRLNGVVAGNGEIVVIDDMMGLRVTDLRTRFGES